jgi:hypothetical protein
VIRKDPPVTGYLVITVPISDDAPHAHQGRFYGRFGSTSAPLKHEEVRRYFEDRVRRTASQDTTTTWRCSGARTLWKPRVVKGYGDKEGRSGSFMPARGMS